MITLPYETSGQQLGETRLAMTKTLMREHIENAINDCKHLKGKFYILVHAKPFPEHLDNVALKVKGIIVASDKKRIKLQIIKGIPVKPHMMLSCILFGFDNDTGVLTLEWSLAGDWPTWSVQGTNEPIPEVIAYRESSGIKYHYEDFLPD
jgi:hypothetical protein